MAKSNKEPKVSKEVDRTINSLSLALTFIALGVLLTVIPNFMGDELVTSALRWLFVVLGAMGFFSSFGEKDSEIKGTDGVTAGIFCLAVAVALYLLVFPFHNLLSLLVALFGIFGLVQGFCFILYTTSKKVQSNRKSSEATRSISLFAVVELMTKIVALVLIIVQLIKLLA